MFSLEIHTNKDALKDVIGHFFVKTQVFKIWKSKIDKKVGGVKINGVGHLFFGKIGNWGKPNKYGCKST